MPEPIRNWEAYTASVQTITDLLYTGETQGLALVTPVLAEVKRQLAYLRRCENGPALIRQELYRNREREMPLMFMSLPELKRFHHQLLQVQASYLEEMIGTEEG